MKHRIKKMTAVTLVLMLIVSVIAPVSASALSYGGSSSYRSGKYYRQLSAVQLTGNQRTDIVNVAKSQIGYQEGSSSSRLSGEVRGSANCTEYGRWYGLQDMWCAMFVSWCANTAGISNSIVPKHCYTPSGLSWFKSRGLAYSRATVANGGYTPKAGDIIYFKSSRNSNSTNHIGIVTGYSNRTVYTIEGNTSSATISTNGGAVAAKSYSISNTYIVYICKPNYSGSNIATGTAGTVNAASSTAKAMTFDAGYYSAKYSDLKKAYGTDSTKLYTHYLTYGIKEGRQASPLFNVSYYLNNNADLKKAFGSNYTTAYNHYLSNGINELRITAQPANLGNDFIAKMSYSGKNLSLSDTNVILYQNSDKPAQKWRFIRQSNGSYKIVNQKNNYCLAVNSGSSNSGANVIIAADNGTKAQRWFIYERNGKYVLKAACTNTCVLTVNGGATADCTNIQQNTYSASNSQLFAISKITTNTSTNASTTVDAVNINDTTAPTITNVTVSELSNQGYRVTCNVSDNVGVNRVYFPTWTAANGQDDLIWHPVPVSNGVATFYIKVSDHKNESGKYNTHIYAYDAKNNYGKATTVVTVPAAATADTVAPTVKEVNITEASDAGYRVTCKVSDNVGVTKVYFPTWTKNNGQDDLVWHLGTVSNGVATFYVKTSAHKNELGKYITHIYAYDAKGNYGKAETEVIVRTPIKADNLAVSSNIGTASTSQMEVIRKIIYAVETGGQVYGNARYDAFVEAYTNTSNEHAITIGAGQWYATEAKRLLNLIRSTSPATFKSLDTAGIATDLDTKNWSTYQISKTSAKAKCIQKIISSSAGIKCQDQLIDEQMKKYMDEAKSLGVTDIAAQMMCANMRHQGGLSAVKRVLSKTAKPYTLDNIYAALQTDTGNQVGAYRSRQKMVYNALKTKLPATSSASSSNFICQENIPYVFNATYYANKYADLKKAFGYDAVKLYNHFLEYGIKEGRCASPTFDVKYYLADSSNADLKKAYGTDYKGAINHYLAFGLKEGRASHPEFNVKKYVTFTRNIDLKVAYGADYKALTKHFLDYGYNEGRPAI